MNSDFTFLYVSYFPEIGYVHISQSERTNVTTKLLQNINIGPKVDWAFIPVPYYLADEFETRLQGYLGKYLISGFGWFLGCTKEEVLKAYQNSIWFFNTVQKQDTNLDLSRMVSPEGLEMWYEEFREPITKWPFGVTPKHPSLYDNYNMEAYTRKTGSDRGKPKSLHIDDSTNFEVATH